jgi:hypothetical protein
MQRAGSDAHLIDYKDVGKHNPYLNQSPSLICVFYEKVFFKYPCRAVVAGLTQRK